MTSRVVVVGDVGLDIVVRPDETPEPGTDTGAAIQILGGGQAGHVAAWLARRGVQAHLVSRVGADPAGDRRVAGLEGLGVHCHVARDPQRGTATVVVLVDEAGQRTMLTDRGAAAALAPADLPPSLFAEPGHLHLSGYPLLHERSRAAALEALRLATEAGMTVSVTPSSVAPLRSAGTQRFLADTAAAHVCFANLDEAHALIGEALPAAEAASRLAEFYVEAVVTAGAQGAVWCRAGAGPVSSAARGGPVIDTTGAGDAFAAGFLTSWLRREAPEAALAAGTGDARLAVGIPGGDPPGHGSVIT